MSRWQISTHALSHRIPTLMPFKVNLVNKLICHKIIYSSFSQSIATMDFLQKHFLNQGNRFNIRALKELSLDTLKGNKKNKAGYCRNSHKLICLPQTKRQKYSKFNEISLFKMWLPKLNDLSHADQLFHWIVVSYTLTTRYRSQCNFQLLIMVVITLKAMVVAVVLKVIHITLDNSQQITLLKFKGSHHRVSPCRFIVSYYNTNKWCKCSIISIRFHNLIHNSKITNDVGEVKT